MDAIESVFHPSDFSPASELAFAHALGIALACRGSLDLFHAASRGSDDVAWQDFPAVRTTLERWGLLAPGADRSAVFDELGVRVKKLVGGSKAPLRAVLERLERSPVDLVVLSTQAREGIPRWLRPSVAEPIGRESRTATLFVPAGVRGFVAPATGALQLQTLLLPVDHAPPGAHAVEAVLRLADALDCTDLHASLLYVGEPNHAPAIHLPDADRCRWKLETQSGSPVDTILDAARKRSVDLIVMATAGHQGVLDALRGSTTERVLRGAPCPVLAVPAG